MADIKVLDKDQLAQLWNKMNNTFMQSGGVPSSWLASEYEKTLNLFTKEVYQDAYNKYVSLYLKPNTTYTWSCSSTLIKVNINKINYEGTTTEWTPGKFRNVSSGTFTTDSWTYYAFFVGDSSSWSLVENYLNVIMINEGSTALSYRDYGGGYIAHKGDIEPVLLWENGNPHATFGVTGWINLRNGNAWDFKYLIVEFEYFRTWDTTILKFRNNGGNTEYALFGNSWVNDSGSRKFKFDPNDSTIQFLEGYKFTSGGSITSNNDFCVPVRIYGSNF